MLYMLHVSLTVLSRSSLSAKVMPVYTHMVFVELVDGTWEFKSIVSVWLFGLPSLHF